MDTTGKQSDKFRMWDIVLVSLKTDGMEEKEQGIDDGRQWGYPKINELREQWKQCRILDCIPTWGRGNNYKIYLGDNWQIWNKDQVL